VRDDGLFTGGEEEEREEGGDAARDGSLYCTINQRISPDLDHDMLVVERRKRPIPYLEYFKKVLFQFFRQGLDEPRLLVLVLVVPDHRAVDLAEVADLVVQGVRRENPDRLGAVDLL
jgi:hypothetical protein